MSRDVAAAFDLTPAGYGADDDFHARFALRLVSHAGLEPGESVLDFATGTAPAAIAAANAVGPSGRVVGVDISPGMLAHARRNIEAAALESITLVQADGARLPFPSSEFDVVICSSSIVWFAEISAALREWKRVTRPGGRLAFSCLAASALPLGMLFRTHLRSYGVDFPDLNEPLNTPEKCRDTLSGAGYANARIHTERFGGIVATAEDGPLPGSVPLVADPDHPERWEALRSDPVSLWAMVRRGHPIPVPLTEERLHRLDRDFRAEVAALTMDAGVFNPVTAQVVVAGLPDT